MARAILRMCCTTIYGHCFRPIYYPTSASGQKRLILSSRSQHSLVHYSSYLFSSFRVRQNYYYFSSDSAERRQVGVEQYRAAAMAYSMVPRQQRPVGLQRKKWLKASDPAPYKGCVIFLFTLYQLCCSGLELCRRKMEDGSAHVWWLVRRGESRVATMGGSSSAVLMMSSLAQLLVLLWRDACLYPSHGQ